MWVVGTGRGAREESRHGCAEKQVATVLSRAQPHGDFRGPHGTFPGVANKLALTHKCSLSFVRAAPPGPNTRLATVA